MFARTLSFAKYLLNFLLPWVAIFGFFVFWWWNAAQAAQLPGSGLYWAVGGAVLFFALIVSAALWFMSTPNGKNPPGRTVAAGPRYCGNRRIIEDDRANMYFERKPGLSHFIAPKDSDLWHSLEVYFREAPT